MKSDLYLSFVVLFQMIVTTIQLLLPLLGVVSVDTAANYRVIITLLTYLPGIVIVMRRHLNWIVVAFAIYFIVLLFSYELYPASRRFIESSQAITLTPISILSIIFLASILDFSNFKKMMLYIGRASVFISLAYSLAFAMSPFRNYEDSYNMSFGYSMLLPAMFLYTQKSFIDKLSSFIIFGSILVDASRGPVIVLAIFYFIYSLFSFKGKAKWQLVIVLIVIAFAAINVLPRLESFQNSRTVFLLENGELLSHDSGREENVYSVVKNLIWEKPIIGWGIGSDRSFLDGSYAHNIFLEVYLHYGIFIGSFIFLFLLVWCVRTMFSSRGLSSPEEKMFFIMMILFGFFPLLRSGSYLVNVNFAILIGYLIRINRGLKPKLANNK